MSHNSAYENQYLENDRYNMEIGNLESMESLFENNERGDFEDSETMLENGENWELGELGESGENWEAGEIGESWEAGQFEVGQNESQFEGQYEGQYEGDRFVGGLLRRIVPQVAGMVGNQLAGQQAGQLAQALANNVLREVALEGDRELNPEANPEAQMEAIGIDREVLAEMAYLAEQAAAAESLQEADRFFGAIANLAGQILPNLLGETDRESAYEANYEGDGEGDRFLPLIPLAAMAGKALLGKGAAKIGGKLLGRGIRTLGRGLFRNRRTRPLVRALPRIVNRTIVRVNNSVRSAPRRRIPAPIIARTVVSSFPRAIASTLATPERVNSTLYQNRMLARRYQFSGTVTVRPVRRRMRRY